MEGGLLARDLCFYSEPPSGEPPEYIAETTEEPGKRNYPHHRMATTIRDIRGREDSFLLDKTSFMAIPNAYPRLDKDIVDFDCAASIKNDYLPRIQDLILEMVKGSKRVVVFDYTVRHASKEKAPASQVRKIHIDQSPLGAFGRVRRHLGQDDNARILAGHQRFRIINAWKPICGPVKDHPLAFADCQSLRETDLVKVKQVYPDYTGETYAVKHHPLQRFWYWSQMTPADVLLLQCFDSYTVSPTDVAGLVHSQCAHGSFELDDTGGEAYERASIEVRCLVLCETGLQTEKVD